MLNRLHPASVHFPIGLLFGAWLFVLGRLFFPALMPEIVVTISLVLGLISSIPAVATGLWELVRVGDSASSEAERTLWWHLGLVGTSVSIFLATLIVYLEGPILWAVVLSTAGVALLVLGAHFGGSLVYKHRIGLDAEDGAAPRGENVDADGGS
ncbi:DUF2231 domain-containing protein [Pontimonas sp.]|uniref:DUF2231 domain-containing protein n=1 Tax=Pontimonas sp. TaxID=2304492 RepID=UPI0037C7C886